MKRLFQRYKTSPPSIINHWPKRYIKVLLALMTAHIEQESGVASSVATVLAGRKSRFELERIWANHPERHCEEFTASAEFAEYRDRFGALLLLLKNFNASDGDVPNSNPAKPNASKLPHYLTQDLLVRSLYPQRYDSNSGFKQFIVSSGLPFKAHEQFEKMDLAERSGL